MGRRLRTALMATGFALVLGSGAFVGYGKYQDHQARETRIQALVDRFKGCPERFRSIQECFTPEEKMRIVSEAERLRDQGNAEEAGMRFARISTKINEARDMAGICESQGNDRGRSRIHEELEVRGEAVRRTTADLEKAR